MRRLALRSLVFAAFVLGCGSGAKPPFDEDGGTGDGGPLPFDPDADFVPTDATPNFSLTVVPPNPVLTYAGVPVTQQFQALYSGSPVTADWSLDNVTIGAISNTGLFTASGTAGGVATVTAQSGKNTGSTTVTVNLALTENPGNVPANIIAQLKGGGNADAQFRWLYPYNKTVFPRGLTGPTLQFGGAAIQQSWVHIETASKSLVYDGFFGAASPARIDLPAATWKTVTLSGGKNEAVTIGVTKISGGQVTGPVKETWSFAQAALKGTVYYNSYNSQLANGIGAVLKLKPGGNAQILSGGNGKCTVCHTVSADGSTMIASNNTYSTGAKYDLKNNASMSGQRNDHVYNFPAVYPDGSLALSTADDKIGGMWTGQTSHLYDVANGQQVAAPGFDGTVKYAGTPVFSPDGTKIAFNNQKSVATNAPSIANELTVMDFNVKTKTFSNLKMLASDVTTNLLGWPSFTPDAKFVVYDHHLGTQSGNGNGTNYGTWFQQRSKMDMADAATKTVYPLSMLGGHDGNTLYLPFGADDEKRDYEPNVLPLGAGGYFWVVFTSRRQYGNTINTVETGNYGDTARKKLWVSAIDLNPQPGTDPSHPAFYLPGQEVASGNMRAFWVLDPCKGDGQTCESGDECCGGYCRQINVDGGQQRVCVPPPGGCSNEFEKCTTAADCCDKTAQCINGHCAQPPPK